MTHLPVEPGPSEPLGRLVAEILFGDELTVASPTQHWTQRVEAVWGWSPGTINRAMGVDLFPSPLSRYRETTLALAERVVAWCEQNQKQLDRASRTLERERAWEVEIREHGSVPALLAHPVTRGCLWTLVHGEKPGQEKIGNWTRKQKAIAAAKAILQVRSWRRLDHEKAESARRSGGGRFHKRWIDKLKAQAMKVAWDYHRSTHPLFQSKYGDILYGRGGQETQDRERYSKGYHHSFGPARCLNGGVRLDSEEKPTCFILENYRGTEVCRVSLKGGF